MGIVPDTGPPSLHHGRLYQGTRVYIMSTPICDTFHNYNGLYSIIIEAPPTTLMASLERVRPLKVF